MKNWKLINNSLQKNFEFNDFETAIIFMQLASVEISKINHHPEWKNIYNMVEVKLCTHDAENSVTKKDEDLANILDEVFERITTKN